MSSNISLADLPTWLIIVGAVVGIAQLAFEIWALVDMLKRPAAELTLGGRKWLWAILILAINWVGAIVYFVAGRKPAAVADVASAAPATERAAGALDSLYGSREGGETK